MKILYLTDPGLDYLADQLYMGLCRVLSSDKIIDFPYKAPHHDPAHKAFYLPQHAGHRYEQDDILCLRNHEIDLIVASFPRAMPMASFDLFLCQPSLPPVVLIDGEDDSRFR